MEEAMKERMEKIWIIIIIYVSNWSPELGSYLKQLDFKYKLDIMLLTGFAHGLEVAEERKGRICNCSCKIGLKNWMDYISWDEEDSQQRPGTMWEAINGIINCCHCGRLYYNTFWLVKKILPYSLLWMSALNNVSHFYSL